MPSFSDASPGARKGRYAATGKAVAAALARMASPTKAGGSRTQGSNGGGGAKAAGGDAAAGDAPPLEAEPAELVAAENDEQTSVAVAKVGIGLRLEPPAWLESHIRPSNGRLAPASLRHRRWQRH